MRVLVASTPGAGHVFPLVPLAQVLEASGHDVLWAVPPSAVPTIEQLGMRARPAGINRPEATQRALALEPDFLDRFYALSARERRAHLYPMVFVRIEGAQMLDDLRAITREWAPDLVLHEPNAVAAAPLAVSSGVPHVVVGFGGFAPKWLYDAAADAMRALWRKVELPVPPWGGLYDDLYLHPMPPAMGPEPFAPSIRPLRPMGFDGSRDGEPPSWLTDLGRTRPLVYVTFGTEIAGMAPFSAVLEGLAAQDVDVLANVGRGVDPRSVSTGAPNVRVEQYVPQRMVLERTAVMVSHAGSGAMLGAAARAIPQLCIPIAADQPENADAVVGAGLGLAIEPEAVDADAVARSVAQLLDDGEFGRRARAVADEIAAMPEPAAMVPAIEALA